MFVCAWQVNVFMSVFMNYDKNSIYISFSKNPCVIHNNQKLLVTPNYFSIINSILQLCPIV